MRNTAQKQNAPDVLSVENLTPKSGGDFAAQCRSILDGVGDKLSAAGLGWKDVVWAKIRLVGMNENFKIYNGFWAERFGALDAQYHPCRTTASVQSLPSGASIEMDFFARKKEARNFTVCNSARAPDAVGLYQHAIRMGDTLYISGIGPRVKGSAAIPGVTEGETRIPPETYEIEPQIRSVFNNITYILNDAGFAWTDLCGGRFYLTAMARDYPAFETVWSEYWNGAPAFMPEMLEVTALPTTINAEMDCVAVKKGEPKP